jgi:hypothetical protein
MRHKNTQFSLNQLIDKGFNTFFGFSAWLGKFMVSMRDFRKLKLIYYAKPKTPIGYAML